MEIYLSTMLAYGTVSRRFNFTATLQSVMLHSGHYAVFLFQLTDSILYFDILLNFSLRYVMRLRYIVLFHYFRLGYQFYVVILRDISTHHALK